MADLILKQTVSLVVAKQPDVTGAAIVEKYFDAQETVADIDNFDESNSSRFSLPASAVDQSMSMGSVGAGHLLAVKADGDLLIKITTTAGELSPLRVRAGRYTIMHIEFVSVKLSNPSSSKPVKGQLLIAGQ